MRRAPLIFACTGVLLLSGVAAADTDSATKLATLDCQCSPSQRQVAPYRIALNALRPKCKEGPEKLAGFAWFIHNDLAKHGKHVTGLGGLRLLNKSVPPSEHKINCQSVAAALLVLIEG
jgi:hypothetical protein